MSAYDEAFLSEVAIEDINMLRAATSTVLPHQNAMPVENVVKSMFYGPDETTSYFCQACNKGIMTGDFMFDGTGDIRKLFRNLGQ